MNCDCLAVLAVTLPPSRTLEKKRTKNRILKLSWFFMNFIFHKPTLKSTGGKSIFETTCDIQKLFTWQILMQNYTQISNVWLWNGSIRFHWTLHSVKVKLVKRYFLLFRRNRPNIILKKLVKALDTFKIYFKTQQPCSQKIKYNKLPAYHFNLRLPTEEGR